MLPDYLNQDGIRELMQTLDREKAGNEHFSYSYDPVAKRLTIRGAEAFPALYDFAELVEILDMSHGYLSYLPADFHRMSHLKVAFFSHNDFEDVPVVLGRMGSLKVLGMKSCNIRAIPEDALSESLRWLTLTDNKIERLPVSIRNVKDLEKLLLAGNRLSGLPAEIEECQRLALIRISANLFQASPLRALAHLPQLAWYADAGNPFSPAPSNVPTREIPWNELELAEILGESAQNKVYKARMSTGEEVAVKMYGGDVTSDGYAQDDMQASIAAGVHQHLIGAIGRIIGMPEGRNGLVLPLIPSHFHKLGQPPNLNTCSRDTFPADMSFSPNYILTVLQGVSQACGHLHSLGIMHGDIYAHNTLVNEQGHAYVGDFGSASFYDPRSDKQRQLIDVRAFGCLVDDLLNRCSDVDDARYQTLADIREACLKEDFRERPTFQDIVDVLK